MKKKISSVIQYLIVFAGFIAMYFFIIPGSDNYYFSRDYENTVLSILWNSLHYGNGRLLGNIVGIGVVQNFVFGFIVTAAILTLLVYAINKLFFNGNSTAIMPMALIIAFPNMRFISDVYEEIPTVANYVLPIALFFCALCFVKNGKKNRKSVLNGIPAFIIAAASCLCSENTTISIFTMSVLYVIYRRITDKKFSLSSVILAAGSTVGSAAMVLIPKLTGSADELDYYRGTAGSVISLIKQCFVNYFTFADVFSSFAFITAIISAGLIILLVKKSDAKKSLKTVLISGLAASPAEFVAYTLFAKNAPYSIYMYVIQSGFVTLYALCLLISILVMKKSDIKTASLGFYILTLSSIGPVMIVNICGYRTFYHTFVIALSFAVYLLKKTAPEIKNAVRINLPENTVKSACAVALSIVFLGMSANIFVQSVYNYNYHIERTNSIAEAINNKEAVVEVPTVPCGGLSNEDEFPSLLDSLLYKYEGDACKIKVVTFGSEKNDSYYGILERNPLANIINAFSHLKYKNVEVIDELTGLK